MPLDRQPGVQTETVLHPDRLFPLDSSARSVARDLYDSVKSLPIVSMHGHIDAALFAANTAFDDPVSLFLSPDHYLTRLLHSQGVPLEALGVGRSPKVADPRSAWRLLCERYAVLAGTASHMWLKQELGDLFDIEEEPSAENADEMYDRISERLGDPDLRPRALYDRFGIEVLATTDSPLSDLRAHRALKDDPEFSGNVIPTFRPDDVIDPSKPGWSSRVAELGELTNTDTNTLDGFRNALWTSRERFIEMGAVATDHGHPSADTTPMVMVEAAQLYEDLLSGREHEGGEELLRAHMLFEMAGMSSRDGLVMQLHPGVCRDHDLAVSARLGPDIGADFPVACHLTEPLRPLLAAYGSDPRFRCVAYTIDETAYVRELAPMASYYPALRIGAPWWFLDAPDAMRRCWRGAVESAGFFNFAGFVDDSRSLASIRARHDMARRIVCGELALLVCEHRVGFEGAAAAAYNHTYEAPKQIFAR